MAHADPDETISRNTEALVRDIQAGDPESFGGLYARVAPALHAWANLRIRPGLRSWLDPEDLVQEVCCRAFRDFSSYDRERGVFRAWIFGIANAVLRRALLQFGRMPAPRRPSSLEESSHLLDEIPEEATSVGRRVARDETLRMFLETAAGLSDLERRLLVFRGIEGLPHEEVARLLDLTPEGTRKRWQRLRERLQESPGARLLLEG